MYILFALLFVTSCSLFGGGKVKAPESKPNKEYVKPPLTPVVSNKVTWSSGRSDLRILALTFDDGPHPQNTPRLLDILKRYNVKATFYTIGRSVDRYPRIAKRIIDEGHEIGNHTYTHGNLSKMNETRVRREMNKGRDAIYRATGVMPTTMRPPYGALFKSQRKWIKDNYGYPTILWSVDPMDWRDRKASVVANRLITKARPGGILLAHDLHKTTIDAIPETLDKLLSRGYEFVTISELIRFSQN